MIIRELEKTDIPALAELAARTYTETFGYSMKPEELAAAIAEKRSPAYFERVFDRDPILVADREDMLIGFIQLGDVRMKIKGTQPTERDKAINALYIHSGFQGQGIGKSLMAAAFAHTSFKKAENIYLHVWDENKRAFHFYEKYGFETVGAVEILIGGKLIGYDLAMMRPLRIKA